MSTNPLTDVLPPKVRKVLYALGFVMGLVFSGWLAADGDWIVFAGSLSTSLVTLLALSNVPKE